MTRSQAAKPAAPKPADAGAFSRLFAAFAVCGVLIFGVGGWAASASISSAVIASGRIVVDSNAKKIQHQEGGIVAAIHVSNGQRVTAGETLVSLDATQTRAGLNIVSSQLRELKSRRARLEATRSGAATITFDASLLQDADAQELMQAERRLFASNKAASDGEKSQLRQRIAQLREEIVGLTAQRDAKARELTLVRDELGRLNALYEKKLTPVTRVLSMTREETRIAGEHAALISQIARTRGRITETELQIISRDQITQADAGKELGEIVGQIAGLEERRIAAVDMLKRIDLRAPRTGIVHDLAVHTVGGVIKPGEPIMLIVPDDDPLTIEVRIAPADIDQVQVGQPARIRFSAFSQQTTPEVHGVVSKLAADLLTDPATSQTYYGARVKLDDDGAAEAANLTLVPGMPVEAFIETGQRTPLSYLMKPVTDQFERAFREG